MTITDVINRFNTTPFLFVGSGMSRRYFDLPDWRGLLDHFAREIRNDEFAYSLYETRAKAQECPCGIMPKIAELIEKDYNEKWLVGEVARTVDAEVISQIVSAGLSPFKAEIAAYIKGKSVCNEAYTAEIEKLTEISEKSIAGVITTNYDSFIEDHFRGFKKYVGQGQLVFSAIQGVAEIYKIHGSIEKPQSIIINEKDYEDFNDKRAYLAAKLLTIFMEYPIVFIGYSISDSNIQDILTAIVNCLEDEQLRQLENRFVFVEYKADAVKSEVSSHTVMINRRPLVMTKITLSDFLPLYEAIGTKKAKLPVRILRQFKQELYSYVITNTPTAALHVASIEDDRVGDDELVLAIGRADQHGVHGLSGINGNEWYRSIMLDDLPYTADELLEHAFPVLIKQNSNRLPVNKYLATATGSYPECEKLSQKLNIDEIIPNSYLQYRGTSQYHSFLEVWQNEKENFARATRQMCLLNESEMNVQELEQVLNEIFMDKDALDHVSSGDRSNIRRLILIYDFLKWHK